MRMGHTTDLYDQCLACVDYHGAHEQLLHVHQDDPAPLLQAIVLVFVKIITNLLVDQCRLHYLMVLWCNWLLCLSVQSAPVVFLAILRQAWLSGSWWDNRSMQCHNYATRRDANDFQPGIRRCAPHPTYLGYISAATREEKKNWFNGSVWYRAGRMLIGVGPYTGTGH